MRVIPSFDQEVELVDHSELESRRTPALVEVSEATALALKNFKHIMTCSDFNKSMEYKLEITGNKVLLKRSINEINHRGQWTSKEPLMSEH